MSEPTIFRRQTAVGGSLLHLVVTTDQFLVARVSYVVDCSFLWRLTLKNPSSKDVCPGQLNGVVGYLMF